MDYDVFNLGLRLFDFGEERGIRAHRQSQNRGFRNGAIGLGIALGHGFHQGLCCRGSLELAERPVKESPKVEISRVVDQARENLHRLRAADEGQRLRREFGGAIVFKRRFEQRDNGRTRRECRAVKRLGGIRIGGGQDGVEKLRRPISWQRLRFFGRRPRGFSRRHLLRRCRVRANGEVSAHGQQGERPLREFGNHSSHAHRRIDTWMQIRNRKLGSCPCRQPRLSAGWRVERRTVMLSGAKHHCFSLRINAEILRIAQDDRHQSTLLGPF